METGEVKDRLLELLPNLRLFTCEPDLGERPSPWVDQDGLEAMLAYMASLMFPRPQPLDGQRGHVHVRQKPQAAWSSRIRSDASHAA